MVVSNPEVYKCEYHSTECDSALQADRSTSIAAATSDTYIVFGACEPEDPAAQQNAFQVSRSLTSSL